MLSEMKQREVEMQQQLEQERAKLQQLQAEKEVAIAAARVRAYDSFEGFENHHEEINNKTSSACYRKPKTEPQLNPNVASFQPRQTASEMTGVPGVCQFSTNNRQLIKYELLASP